MKTIATKLLMIGTLFSLIAMLPGCKDDETEVPYKLMVPSKATATAEYNTITVHWTQSTDAIGYEVTMASDAQFSDILKTVNPEYIPDEDDKHKTEYDVVFEDLEPYTTYYFRLKTLSADPSKNSNYSYREATTGEEAPFFDPIEESRLGYNYVTLTWSEAINADKIVLTDKESVAPELTFPLNSEALSVQSVTLPGLTPGVTYRAKLYLGEEYLGYIDVPVPSADNYVTDINVGFDFATLSWDEKLFVNKIVLTSVSGADGPFTKELESSETGAHQATITGLTSGSTYKATLYWDDQELGQSSEVITNTIDGEIVSDPATLKEKIENAAEGAKFYLPADLIFDCSAENINVTKSISLIGLASSTTGKSRPTIYLASLVIGGDETEITVNKIRFENLDISGLKPVNGAEDLTVEPNRRLLCSSLSRSSTGRDITINSVELEGCTVRNYSINVFGLESSLGTSKFRVGDITINDCVIFDIGRNNGGYNSIVHLQGGKDDANAQMTGTFKMTNSTLYYIYFGLIEAQWNECVTPYVVPQGVIIEDCTFDRFGVAMPAEGLWMSSSSNSGRQFINFDKLTDATVPLTVNRCIFGEMKYNNSSPGYGARDFQRKCSAVNTDKATNIGSSDTFNSGGTGTYFNKAGQTGAELFPNRDINMLSPDYTPMEGYQDRGDPRWLK